MTRSKKLLAVLGTCVLALAVSACATKRSYYYSDYELELTDGTYLDIPDADLIPTTYDAVDRMMKRARKRLAHNQKIMTSTFVNLDNMDRTHSFGRLLGELAAARLTQNGYSAMNLNVRDGSVGIVPNEGQFALTRNMQLLSERYDAEAVLVGTYVEAQHVVYVNMRLVMTKDNVIAASWDMELPKGPKTRALLGYEPVQPTSTAEPVTTKWTYRAKSHW